MGPSGVPEPTAAGEVTAAQAGSVATAVQGARAARAVSAAGAMEIVAYGRLVVTASEFSARGGDGENGYLAASPRRPGRSA